MNDVSKPTKDSLSAERPFQPNERRSGPSIVLAADDVVTETATRRISNLFAFWLILLFWGAQFCAFTAEQLLVSPETVSTYFWPRLMTSGLGALLSFGMAAGQAAVSDRKLAVRAATALVLAIASAALASLMAFVIERPFVATMPPLWPNVLPEFYPRIFTYGSISGIILAVSYAGDIRGREQRIAALQALAESAQLRALRNQLNPHFLFNALNSIAGLIAGGRAAEAESMTENVADFLRMSIAMDPHKLISLAEELRLQDLYLTIEKGRFPDRLVVDSDVPDELCSILVPALITQPLIENSIKYAVARSTAIVKLSIRAREVGQALELIIEDDGGNAEASTAKGTRLGLSNVTERLRAHYGPAASFHASRTDGSGFRNIITIPHGTSASNPGR